MNNQKQAILETKIDWFETEYERLNEMLQKCGFPDGLRSLKLALAELLKSKEEKA